MGTNRQIDRLERIVDRRCKRVSQRFEIAESVSRLAHGQAEVMESQAESVYGLRGKGIAQV
jgi:hypothetical protein